MQIPENIKYLSAYNIGLLLHKKKICPIDLVNFYFHEINSFKENSPYTVLTKKRALIEAALSKKRISEENTLSPLDGVILFLWQIERVLYNWVKHLLLNLR